MYVPESCKAPQRKQTGRYRDASYEGVQAAVPPGTYRPKQASSANTAPHGQAKILFDSVANKLDLGVFYQGNRPESSAVADKLPESAAENRLCNGNKIYA